MVIVALYLALYFGLFGLFSSFVIRNPLSGSNFSQIISLFIIPAGWVALEWLRSTGPAGFGWALLGHSQSFGNLAVIQIADIVGAYGVSFVIVMVNFTIFLVIKHSREIYHFFIPLIVTTLIVFLVLAYGNLRLKNIYTGEKIKVAVIQGNIPQTKKWDYKFRFEILNKYETLTKEALKDNPDLIVWPETSVPGFLEEDRDLSERIKALVKYVNKPMLFGAPREDEVFKERYYNSAILFSEDGRVSTYYDKLHLVPFGEYVPFKNILSFVERFAQSPIGDFSGGRDFTVFKFLIERSSKIKDYSWRLVKKIKFSCLICFEDIFPGLVREFVQKGADFLVVITNDAWFGKTSAAYQHTQASILRAVENRVNVVRAANTGLSCFIDQKGKVTSTVSFEGEDLFVDGFKSADITLTRGKTFYNIYGDAFTYICIFITSVYLLNFVFYKKFF